MDILLRQLDLWYQSIPGKMLLETEIIELNKILPKYFGSHLVQMGGPSECLIFEKTPISHCVRLSPEYASVFKGPCVQGSLESLCFLSDSVDVILLPHVLEFIKNPMSLLKEINTILKPEGVVVILSFNSLSLWGIAKFFHRHKRLPWKGHFPSMMQLCQWLKKSEFEIIEKRSTVFRPYLKQQKYVNKLFFLEVLGRVCWTSFGAVNMVVAKKRTAPLTPIKRKKQFVSRYAIEKI
jgi:SAM-dependent methyltransferase